MCKKRKNNSDENKNSWEELSKLSKYDVLNSSEIIAKINHTSSWNTEFAKIISSNC